MKTIVLAGGEGRRLQPYTFVLPKPLMPLGNEPVLRILLEWLDRHGIRDVALAVGPQGPILEAYFQAQPIPRVRLSFLREPRPLSTMGPIALARAAETFLVVNGDTYTDLDLGAMIRAHRDSGAALTVAATEREVPVDLGVLRADGDRLIGFDEKPKLRYLAAMGVNLVEPAAAALIPDGRPFGFDELVLAALSEGLAVRVFRHAGFWFDIGREEDFRLAQEHYEVARRPPA